uniref:Cytochrome P450 n=1 Tax=Salix viminalis TaxID=40686 RepID=A0A6N2KLC1_SALVM
MELTLLLLSLAPLILLLVIRIFSLKDPSHSAKNLPPGSLGWPIFGETLEFLFGKPEKFVFDRMKKYSSDIFKTRILGEKTVVICGPDGNKYLLQEAFHCISTSFDAEALSFHQAAAPIEVSREAASKILRSPGFLKPEALVRYLGKMDSITQQQMQTYWEGKDEVKAFPFAKTLTLSLACRFFLGSDDPERIARLVSNFDDVTLGMHSIPSGFPGTTFTGLARLPLQSAGSYEKSSSQHGREHSAGYTMHMILARSGKHMTEAEIAGKILGVLVAGYSTVATAMTFFMKYVGQRPDIYAKILTEQTEVATAKKAGELLDWDDIQKMKYSWNVIYEVMRLTPPIQGAFREALTDFTYAGYTIPKGWKIYWTVSTTNKNPKYFPDPENLDPSRYDDGKAFPAFTFVPFGAGPGMCPGKEYARLAILTFVHNVVKRFKWEVVFPEEKIVGDMIPSPEKGLPIRIQSHSC